MMQFRGDYIAGTFAPVRDGEQIQSINPTTKEVVFSVRWHADQIDLACTAAAAASQAWGALTRDERYAHLLRFREAIAQRKGAIAEAICDEIGKIHSESHTEVAALLGRFAIVKNQIDTDMTEGSVPGFPSEEHRFHAHGVVGVIGPFNFPLHLCHAHALPALLMGNTVVIKPSELAPKAAQLYAEAAHAAELPAGVLNLVHGGGAAGARLTQNPHVRGLCFTGSYATGRRITEATLDRPELLVALEMGGKNTVIVRSDADIRQAAHEAVIGGYLTTGQRCTCTDRVLVHRAVADKFIQALKETVAGVKFGDPRSPGSFAGPMASGPEWERYNATILAAEAAGAEPIVAHTLGDTGFFASASVHRIEGEHRIDGYTDEELFGPNLSVHVIDDDDAAMRILNRTTYGFANAVFTRDEGAFDDYVARCHAGIWNLNRTTNQASPRLPFGGVGRSGNYRPAGAYASRNVSYPMAMQRLAVGHVAPHSSLIDNLPPADLDHLEAVHVAEEASDASRRLTREPRPLDASMPSGGTLPLSQHWLERFYAGGRFAKEKKPGVYDHLRSHGPWFVSVDQEPLAVLDGMSQTATLPGGFSDDAVVKAFADGAFGETTLRAHDTTQPNEYAEAFADTLRELVPGLPHVAFANSGAEANEKALALCRLHTAPNAKRVLAFEGGFHGRTLLALHATYNPSKRGPFEFAGYETSFAPFPLWNDPAADEPTDPTGYLKHVASGDLSTLAATFADAAGDALLASEIASLIAVDEILRREKHIAVLIEPMQSEGGDRYATGRYFRALRVLTRRCDIPMVFDEVQTGFGLGGPFTWHSLFNLVTADGAPDGPDAIIFAKRAQTGVVMSRFEDPEPSHAHTASLVRGRVHALAVGDGARAAEIEAWVRPRLAQIAAAYPQFVSNARGRGYAFAFDLPESSALPRYIGQRFWRGAIVFAAGSRTVRYRLCSSYDEATIERLFESVRRSLSWMDANPNGPVPAWQDDAASNATYHNPNLADSYRLRRASQSERAALLPRIVELEAEVYEVARRDPPDKLGLAFGDNGVAVVAEMKSGSDWLVVGSALACPIEQIHDVQGPDTDPLRGTHTALYSLAITVGSGHRGVGLGSALKAAQIEHAGSGDSKIRWITGRNRVGAADEMTRLNVRFGAHTVAVYDHQYDDPSASALYYRIPVGPLVAPGRAMASETIRFSVAVENVSNGIAEPFAEPPASLADSEAAGALTGPATTKITICNYITPAIVRAVEWATALTPQHPHIYLTSSRDETFDKTVRLLKYHRTSAKTVIGLQGCYVGHTTAAARSLSDPSLHKAGTPLYDWPRIAHPADGVAASLASLDAAIRNAGGAEAVLGIFVEPVGERSGKVVPAEYWTALDAFRDRTGVPIVAVENASALYRSGGGAFATSDSGFVPDILTWWNGGQTGYVHVSTPWFVAKPLTFVSTWDGDELSLIRQHHQLREARKLGVNDAIGQLDACLASCKSIAVRGLGLHRVILPVDIAAFDNALTKAKLTMHRAGDGFIFSPHLDVAAQAVDRLQSVLSQLG